MKCNTCNTEFKDMTGHEQASGCAATLYLSPAKDWYILAHYGSKYDMQRYALKNALYNPGNICDDCINHLIKNGSAWMIEDGVW